MQIRQFRSFSSGTKAIWNQSKNSRSYHRRETSFEEANKFAEENKMAYIETSAKTGENVAEVSDRYETDRRSTRLLSKFTKKLLPTLLM